MVVLAVIVPVLMLGVIMAMGWYEDLVLPPPERSPEQPGPAGVPLPPPPAPGLPAASPAPALPAPSPNGTGRRRGSSPAPSSSSPQSRFSDPAGSPGPFP